MLCRVFLEQSTVIVDVQYLVPLNVFGCIKDNVQTPFICKGESLNVDQMSSFIGNSWDEPTEVAEINGDNVKASRSKVRH